MVLVGGVLAALAPLVGVVNTYDGSAVDAWAVAGWVAVLPGLLAVILALTGPVGGLAAAAGAGVVGGARFVMDLPVLLDPGSIARPELFVETTARAEPFRATAGGVLLLVADLVMLAGGVLGAVWLSRAVSAADGPPVEAMSSSDRTEPAAETDQDTPGPNDGEPAPGDSGSLVVLPERPRRRNNVMLVVGFLGVLLILGGTLPVPYTGGYLLERFVPVGGDVIGTLGVILLAGVAAVAVLCAVQLPRYLAVALLAGTALAAAVPALVAVVAVLAGAPAALGGAVWFALAGAVLLGASGALSQVRLVSMRADDWAARPGSRVWVGILGLIAAGLSAAAGALPILHVDGRAEVVAAGAVAQDAALPIVFLGAAVVLGLGAVLTLVPATAVIGRPVLMVAVGGSAFAIARSLDTLTVLIAGTRQTAVLGIVTPRTWSAGPGLWCGVGAVLVAAAAAVLARLDDRRVAGDALDVADDDALADSRRLRGLLAAAAAVTTAVVLCLPTYRTLQGPSATLLGGFALDTWGVWALLGVTLGALVCAALDGRPAVVGAFPAASAAVVALRLLVPASVRSGPDFSTAAGTAGSWVLVAVLVATSAAMVILTRRVPRAVAPALDLAAARVSAPKRSAGGGAKRSAGAKVDARPARKGKRR